MTTVRDLTLVHAGDKGNTSNLVVVADSEAAYERLADQFTTDRVGERFAHLGTTEVTRYDVLSVHAFNYVLEGMFGAGSRHRSASTRTGKSLSSLLAGTTLLDRAETE